MASFEPQVNTVPSTISTWYACCRQWNSDRTPSPVKLTTGTHFTGSRRAAPGWRARLSVSFRQALVEHVQHQLPLVLPALLSFQCGHHKLYAADWGDWEMALRPHAKAELLWPTSFFRRSQTSSSLRASTIHSYSPVAEACASRSNQRLRCRSVCAWVISPWRQRVNCAWQAQHRQHIACSTTCIAPPDSTAGARDASCKRSYAPWR